MRKVAELTLTGARFYIVQRIGCGHGPLAHQPVNTNFSLLLPPEDGVAEDLEDQPGALGAREEALLVFTAEELVQLVQSEGSRVVVRLEVGHRLLHHVGQAERGQQAGRPVPAGGGLSLEGEKTSYFHCSLVTV